MGKIAVEIVMGSESDLQTMQECGNILEQFGLSYRYNIISAHRTPDEAALFSKSAAGRGVKIIIAGAGCAAHLAGVIASHTTLPVIGIPISSPPLNGLDSLFSTVQMPGGIPVATMAIGSAGAKNAALFAIRMLSVDDGKLRKKLEGYISNMKENVKKQNEKVSAKHA
ncbi:MAG: 5-(carboxyamino)imidazole ribonucleotide mutase [Candidatus Schekmanbacteria bacterium]|nr:5-(carboxyamino)imidazole ribonucleotide mutase [Candidatus Schekmanbacteria bacterium]